MRNRPAQSSLSRRRFLQALAAAGASIQLFGGGANGAAFARDAAAANGEVSPAGRGASFHSGKAKKTLILAIDGMDPTLLTGYIGAGQMPNFRKLAATGGFQTLATSAPPQSPVAWSNFITGMDPGGHGIFDFIHRDPATLTPYLSMSRTEGAMRRLNLGSWSLPLSGGKVVQLRKGRAFWQILEDNGVPTTIFKIPANFPPVPSKGRSLSGMGTPDLMGSQGGSYTLYATTLPENKDTLSGGKAVAVAVRDNCVEARITGPPNPFRRVTVRDKNGKKQKQNPDSEIAFRVFLDPERPLAKFEVQDHEFILREGEWSDWVQLQFRMAPGLAGVTAAARFYLQSARPDFKLYLSPLQMDPENPAMPISTPENWSAELAEKLGPFYTQGLPADTGAYSDKVLSGFEYADLSRFLLEERFRALDYLIETFEQGLLFFYISNMDQDCHMLWHCSDPKHPAYAPDSGPADGIAVLYREMDAMLGRVMDKLDSDTTLIVMSDHGFAPFYWEVNLNSWLLEKEYLTLRRRWAQDAVKNFDGVVWGKTAAYAFGINGVYVNLKGREREGIIEPGPECERLLDGLERDLLEMRDPERNRRPVTQVIRPARDLHGAFTAAGPDLIVGYNRGYRTSWKSPLGEFPRELFPNNMDAWSADHCMDSRLVPGVLLSNRGIALDEPALYDLPVSILHSYGIEPPPEMIGRNCLAG